MSHALGVQVRDRYGPWLTVIGMVAAVTQPVLGFFGTAVALGCAAALTMRRSWLPALAVIAVTALVLFALWLFLTPVSVEVESGLAPARF